MLEALTSSFSKIRDKLRGDRLTEENVKAAGRLVKQALLEADVALKVVKTFTKTVKEKALGTDRIAGVRPEDHFIGIVHDELVKLIGGEDGTGEAEPLKFKSGRPTVIMMAGLNGHGKTTTAGKLGYYLKQALKKNPLLVAADLARPGAIEQLGIVGEGAGLPVFQEDPKKYSPPEVCGHAVAHAEKNGHDVVILDTAGRRQIDEPLMEELEQVVKTAKPDYIYLVTDGMTGQDAVNSAKGFNDRLELDGVILTKMDGDARGGAALTMKVITGKPIAFMGVGEKVNDFEEFRPRGIADRILGMGDIVSLVKDAQRHVDQEEAERQAEKLFVGEFNFEDFMIQLDQLEKMGGLKQMLDKLPANMLGGLGMTPDMMNDFDEDEIKYVRAIYNSMTKRERRNPDILDQGRKNRIAMGAGVEYSRVNELLKSFKMMRKQFKELTSGAMGGGMLGKMAGKIAGRKLRKEKEKMLKAEKKIKRDGKKGGRKKRRK